MKWLGNVAMVGGLIGLFVHYIRFGPKDDPDHPTENQNEPPLAGPPVKERSIPAPPVTTAGEPSR
jgi:hypothetical protein